jgi:hypothetical protein
MALMVGNRYISRVRLIDDDAVVRSGYRYAVEDLDDDMVAEEVTGPIASVESLLSEVDHDAEAVICDYNLRMTNYSAVNGDEVVKGLYVSRIPVVLCTRADEHLPWPIRQKRRFIPRVLHPNCLEPEALLECLRVCIDEFAGIFTPSRKPYRGLVRVEGGDFSDDGKLVHSQIVVPAWTDQLVPYDFDASFGNVFEKIKLAVTAGAATHFFAHVNLGAESTEELFIDEVEGV